MLLPIQWDFHNVGWLGNDFIAPWSPWGTASFICKQILSTELETTTKRFSNLVFFFTQLSSSSFALWVQCPLMSHACFTVSLHFNWSCAIFTECVHIFVAPISDIIQPLFGLPLFNVPFIIPNTVVLVTLLSFILYICPNRCSNCLYDVLLKR